MVASFTPAYPWRRQAKAIAVDSENKAMVELAGSGTDSEFIALAEIVDRSPVVIPKLAFQFP